jgi:hypothetical protein
MTTQIGPAPRRQSRLIDLIRAFAGQAGGSRLGFSSRQAAPKRTLAVVASFDRADAALLASAAKSGADALEVSVATERELLALAEAAKGITVPVGVVAAYGAAQLVTGLAAEKGLDWVRLPLNAPFSVLAKDKPARIVALPMSIDLRVAHAISDLPVEAVVLEASESSAAELTLGEALRVRALRDATQKLALVDVALGVTPPAVAAVDALAINGLVVHLAGPDTDIIRDYVANLEAAAQKPEG